MTYTATQIANTFIDIASRLGGEQLTNMKLQKLLFFAQGWHMTFRNSQLFDEQVEAWNYGPVVPSVYHNFSGYGAQPITGKAPELCFIDGDIAWVEPRTVEDAETIAFLEAIYRTYGKYSAVQLSRITHGPDTPWTRVQQANGGRLPRGTDIPREWIKEYFDTRRASNTAH